ncbi:MAG TPA: hypothetical protein VH560_19045 [Polyangia bacterium]|jgi:hypothetical protein|nr:hypothetical protein [Polyangia bacterium]
MSRASSRVILCALAATAAGCATTEPQTIVALPAPATTKPAAQSTRLAWLPFDPGAGSELTRATNDRLAHVIVDAATETTQAPVSMEMAQLAIECIEHTPACWSAVGHSLGADLLLWAELERPARGSGVTLRVALFDVGAGALVKNATRPFPSAKAARAGAVGLIDGTFGATTTTTTAGPPP